MPPLAAVESVTRTRNTPGRNFLVRVEKLAEQTEAENGAAHLAAFKSEVVKLINGDPKSWSINEKWITDRSFRIRLRLSDKEYYQGTGLTQTIAFDKFVEKLFIQFAKRSASLRRVERDVLMSQTVQNASMRKLNTAERLRKGREALDKQQLREREGREEKSAFITAYASALNDSPVTVIARHGEERKEAIREKVLQLDADLLPQAQRVFGTKLAALADDSVMKEARKEFLKAHGLEDEVDDPLYCEKENTAPQPVPKAVRDSGQDPAPPPQPPPTDPASTTTAPIAAAPEPGAEADSETVIVSPAGSSRSGKRARASEGSDESHDKEWQEKDRAAFNKEVIQTLIEYVNTIDEEDIAHFMNTPQYMADLEKSRLSEDLKEQSKMHYYEKTHEIASVVMRKLLLVRQTPPA